MDDRLQWRLLQIGSAPPGQWEALVYRYPGVLEPERLARAITELSAVPADETSVLMNGIQRSREALQRIAASAYYPMGFGPVDRAFFQFRSGEITEAAAVAAVQASDVGFDLSQRYVQILCNTADLYVKRGMSERACALQRLVLRAVEKALPSDLRPEYLHLARLSFVDVVSNHCVHQADGLLHREALGIGAQALSWARAAKNAHALHSALLQLADLWSEPYIGHRTPEYYEQQEKVWRERFADEQAYRLAMLDPAEWQMPEPREAIAQAIALLEEAVLAEADRKVNLARRSLARCYTWLPVVGEPPQNEKAAALAQEVLEEIDPSVDPVQYGAVLHILSRCGVQIPLARLQPLIGISPDELLTRYNGIQVLDLLSNTARLFADVNPFPGFFVINETVTLIEKFGDHTSKENYINIVFALVRAAYGSPNYALTPQDISATLALHISKAEEEGWPPRRLSVDLLRLALDASLGDHETEAHTVLRFARERAPLFAEQYSMLFDHAEALLSANSAATALNTGQPALAVPYLAEALTRYMRLGMKSRSLECLRHLLGALKRRDPACAEVFVNTFPDRVLGIERELGDQAVDLIQRMCREAIATFEKQPVHAEHLFLLLHMAKGVRFSAALTTPARYHYGQDQTALDLLANVISAEKEAPLMLRPAGAGPMDENDLLLSIPQANERREGVTAAERLENLQRSFDQHWQQAALSAVPSGAQVVQLHQVQAALDHRSVVLDLYVGIGENNAITYYLIWITREEVFISSMDLKHPDQVAIWKEGTREYHGSPISLNVASVRREIQEEPGVRMVSSYAEKFLADQESQLLKSSRATLEQLKRAGKDHLAIVPHGPLRFLPIHLLGAPNEPLCEQWIITQLPDLSSLVQPIPAPVRSPNAFVALGVGFVHADPHGLQQPLPEAITEVQRLARDHGAKVYVEEEVTPAIVREALAKARWVHIATHGQHNAAAPAFQCLYFWPDGAHHGRLHAYELAEVNMRGLDVLTLSACETALGRYNRGDDLRGLPASFFMAGVATIINTLWPVETNVTAFFFGAFYEGMSKGMGKLNAFAAAQKRTREQYPHYRDWGAFQFQGRWNDQ